MAENVTFAEAWAVQFLSPLLKVSIAAGASNASLFPLIDFILDGTQNLLTLNYANGLSVVAEGTGITESSGTITGGTIDTVSVHNEDGDLVATITGFPAVQAVDLFDALGSDVSAARYQFWTSLVDGDTTGTGGSSNDGFVAGTGNDTISGKGGDDLVVKFDPGNLTYDGGSGSDTLSFIEEIGQTFQNPLVQTLIVNLSAGSGQNPYGGALALTSVENIIGTYVADQITGNAAANVIGDGLFDGGADTINTLGGNDIVKLSPQSAGTKADGGSGTDTLYFNFAGGVHTLDLTDQSRNTGVFGAGGTFKNFEVFEAGRDITVPGQVLNFIGDGAAQIFHLKGSGQTHLAMGGGDDTVYAGFVIFSGLTSADGGAGTDRLVGFRGVLDLLDPANNTDAYANGTFTNFEIFEARGGFLKFVGDARDNVVHGDPTAVFADTLDGGKGKDSLEGGAGDDVLIGGKQKDTLRGGADADQFVFTAVKDTGKNKKKADIIEDFDRAEGDQINLSAIDAKKGSGHQAFKWIGKSKFHDKKGELHYLKKKGFVVVEGDLTGNGKANFAIKVDDISKLKEADFLLEV
ncbi:MAG: calcium-binding protein [Bauldia sp.]|nr:calcium-binding protein [Bauldia sp.]